MSATPEYSRTLLESRDRCCEAMRNARVFHHKLKLESSFHKSKQSFWRLFSSSGLQVISCLSALNPRIASAKYDGKSAADVEVWPDSPNGKCVALLAER